MDTHSLQAFLAVAECGSFSQAAERLHLTQPAVSKRIAALERQMNIRLFDRIGRRITLTETGQALLPRARRILLELQDTERALSNLGGEVSGKLVLATSHHIGLHRLPPLLKRFTHRYPHVKLDMRFLDSEQAYEGVVHGELELAVVTLAPKPDPSLCVVPVWTDTLRFVAAHEHPLARATPITLETLTRFDAVLPGHQTFTRDIVEQAFAQQQLSLQVALSTNYMETLKMMVSIGLGWSLLPESLIDTSMAILDIRDIQLTRPLGYLYHRERTLSNAAARMIELLEDAKREASALATR